MINEIQIKNFKCFLNQKILCNNLTVFAGINGVGKSTAIQALLIIRQTFDKIRQIPVKSTGRTETLSISLKEAYELNLGNSKEITSAISDSDIIELAVVSNGHFIPFRYVASTNTPEPNIDFLLEKDIALKKMIENNSDIFAETFHYLIAERVGPRDFQLIRGQEFLSTGYSGKYTGYAMHKATSINSKYNKVDKEKCLSNTPMLFQKQVEAWMNLIVPGLEINPELYDDINSARVGLRKRTNQTGYLNSVNMGFGITYVLPIIVSSLLAERNCLLIIENPEAHLHPKGQSKIGQFLAQMAGAGIQVIMETHSEHVINGIRIAVLKDIINHKNVTINFFEQDDVTLNPSVKPILIKEDADLSAWPNGFLDQEELDLAEIFKLKRKKYAR